MNPSASKTAATLFLLSVILAGMGYSGYQSYVLSAALKNIATTAASSTETFLTTVNFLTAQNADLYRKWITAQNQNNFLGTQVGVIQNTVNDLLKLKRIDKELLEKYSKVYFLNENYVPSQLAAVDQKYVYGNGRVEQFHTQALPFLNRILADAASSSVPLEIISAYRSFGTQATLKADYVLTYGSGANRFSADQGYSEHQLGTTVDFTTPGLGASFTKLDKSPAYAWLTANAYKYGFILSYPKGNAYYMYEPWHWRFVGVKLAVHLHDANEYFFDMDQREINTYLISIFDSP